MAVTQEFIDQVSEALMVLGDALENAPGHPRGASVITKEEEMTDTLSLPGVMYDEDPITHEDARAVAYVQIPWSVMSSVLASMKTATREAEQSIQDVGQVIDNAQQATAAANTAAENADSSREQIESDEQTRQSDEQTRQSNESTRQSNEQARQSNEQTRQSNEETRETTASSDHTRAEEDHTTAAGDHTTADQDHTRAEEDHEASEAATGGAENVNAVLNGMTVTITNRQGESSSVMIGFQIYRTYATVALMNADAPNVSEGKFVLIATTDKTSVDNAKLYCKNSQGSFSFLADLDQASSEAWADWLENMKPQIEGKIAQAETDHGIAASDHTVATSDHQTATQDHAVAVADHTTAENDHETAENDHTTAEDDHTTAVSDHDLAGTDHETAASDHDTSVADHDIAATDHETAESDHATAEEDNTRAVADHSTAEADHIVAGNDHDDSVAATAAATAAAGNAEEEAAYAKNIADHPSYIADGTPERPGDTGYVYQWDYEHQIYVRGIRVSLDWDTMSQEEKDALAAEVLASLAFDDSPVKDSNKAVRSSGLYLALAGKQDKLDFATDEEADAVWKNYQFATTD